MFCFIPPDDLSLSLFSGFELTANIQYYNEQSPVLSHTHSLHTPFSAGVFAFASLKTLSLFPRALIGGRQVEHDHVTSDLALCSDSLRVKAGFFFFYFFYNVTLALK